MIDRPWLLLVVLVDEIAFLVLSTRSSLLFVPTVFVSDFRRDTYKSRFHATHRARRYCSVVTVRRASSKPQEEQGAYLLRDDSVAEKANARAFAHPFKKSREEASIEQENLQLVVHTLPHTNILSKTTSFQLYYVVILVPRLEIITWAGAVSVAVCGAYSLKTNIVFLCCGIVLIIEAWAFVLYPLLGIL